VYSRLLRTALLYGVAIAAGSGCALRGSDASRIEGVLRADRERVSAMLSADRDALESVLHESLTYTHSNGRVDTKASLIELLTSGRVDYRGIAAHEPTVRLEDSTAIVHGAVRIQGMAEGRPLLLSTISTLVYWHTDGRWQLVAYQSSLVSDASSDPPRPTSPRDDPG
jgi:hypothetical protein